MANGETLTIFCDAVQTLGVHNGVVRITLIRLSPDGKPTPAVELLLPSSALPTLIRALQQIKA